MSGHTSGWAAAAAALMLVLAGCAGGVPSGSTGDADAAAGDGGTVNFYISDQQNAIDQFEHLNVTITEVTLVRAGSDDADEETETAAENETEEADEETDTAEVGNETETAEPTETPESDDGDDEDDGERVTYEVDNVTVDLTELQGANASRLDSIPVPNGTYTKVFVEVGSIEGTLEDGSSAEVKLPSNKLRLNKQFTVGDGQEVDFVFDVTVFERGNQGYVLKPVAGESGTSDEVKIDDVDEDDQRDEEDDADDADDDADEGAAELNAAFVGDVTAGADATVEATRNGSAVGNATVQVTQEIDGEETVETYATDADGSVTFAVDANATELSVEVTDADEDAELEREFDDADSSGGNDGAGDDSAALQFSAG
ncbi:hypothetical protein BRC97_10215 [Halobacteriales archaeon QS_6_71_20]|nr:MAG: hypothetical protein BRC97_10215 [Halobacteriales archaeon QS_6_71_20]